MKNVRPSRTHRACLMSAPMPILDAPYERHAVRAKGLAHSIVGIACFRPCSRTEGLRKEDQYDRQFREAVASPHSSFRPSAQKSQGAPRLMRATQSSARLAEAQSVLAREYGFANWAALQAEVAHRAQNTRRGRAWTRIPGRFHWQSLAERDVAMPSQVLFSLSSTGACIGFLAAALLGSGLIFITPPQLKMLHAALLLGGWQ